MASSAKSSLLSPESLDALFASDALHQADSPKAGGPATVSRRTRQSLATVIDPLEQRIVQSADPVMGPQESPTALQAEIDAFTLIATTLEQEYANAEVTLQQLQDERTDTDDAHAEKTAQVNTLTEQQQVRQLQIASLQQQILETDARIAALQAAGSYNVNWLNSDAPFGTVPGTNGKESFAVTLSPDGTLLARGDRAGTVELINAITGQQLFSSSKSGYVCDLAFDETGRRLASVHTSGAVMIIDTQTHAVTTRTTPTDRMFGSMQWIGDEIYISLQELGCIRIIHAQTGATRVIQAAGMTNGLARAGTDAIFAAGPVGPVSLFSKQGTLLAQAPSPGLALTAAASRDGSMMAVVTWDGNVTVYNRSLQVIGQASGAGKGYRLSFLGNKGLVTYDANGRLLVFTLADIQNGQLASPQVISTTPHQGFSNTMGVTPDGSMIANIDPNNGIRFTRMPSHLQTAVTPAGLSVEQATRASLTQSLSNLQADKTAAQTQLNALEQEKADLEIVRAASDTLIEEIEARLLELQEEIDEAHAQIQVLQERLDALDAVFMDYPDTDLLAAELAASVQSALDADAERIGYAKMFVSYEKVGQSTVFTIRYRNPGQRTVLDIKIDKSNGNTEYLGGVVTENPVEDGTWTFSLNTNTNAGSVLTFRMRDADTWAILTEMRGAYDGASNTARLDAVQTPFDTEEAGMLAENPITPALHLGRIDKGTLLLVVETPYDQFYIDTDMAGILSTAEGSVTGGTTFGLAQITVDTGRPTGYHTIRLYDRKGGQVIDTLTVYFDQPSRTVSLANPADQYSGSTSLEGTDLAQQQSAMQALQNVPLGVAYSDIARNQRLNLYYQTANLPAPYNIYINADRMLTLLFATPQYAKYRPENIQQTIEQEWDNMGTYMEGDTLRHYYDYSHAQTNVELSKRQIVADFMSKLAVYEQGVSECVQSAVNIFLGITQGQPEEPLRQTYDALYAQWSANGIIRSLEGIGMTMPNTWTLRMAAKEVFYDHWEYLVQTQVDVQNVREREEYFLSLGLRKTAEGEWTAVMRGVDGNLLAGLDTKDIKMATTIAQMMKNMSQITEKYNPAAQARIAAEVAGLLGPNATQEDILNAIRSVIGRFDTERLGIGGANISPEQNTAAKKVLAMTNAQIYTEAMKWYNSQISVLSTALPIRQDTIVGKMMAGAADRIWMEQNMEKKYEIIQMVHRLTDIPVQRLIDDWNHSTDATAYASKMMNLLQDAQYSDVLESAAPRLNPAFLTAKPDLPSYNGNKDVRIRFDIATAGKEFQRVVAYIDGVQVTGARNTAFINIPMTSFHQSRNNVQVQLRAFFADGSTADTWSDSFDVVPTSLPTSGNHLSVTDNPIENYIFSQAHSPLDLAAGNWRWDLGSGAHKETDANHAFYAVDLNLGSGNSDRGQPVSPVADGIVFKNIVDSSGNTTVIIKHEINGIVWYSKYLHVERYGYKATGVNPLPDLVEGSRVYAGVPMVEVGKQSNDTEMNAHLHLEILDNLFRSIDIRKFLTNENGMNIKSVTATDGGADQNLNTVAGNTTRDVSWSSTLNSWVSETEKLVYDRSMELQGESQSFWRAWEGDGINQMKIVIWEMVGKDSGGANKFAWVNIDSNNMKSIWSQVDGIFKFTSLQDYKLQNHLI